MILMFLINFGEIRSCIDKSNKKLIKELTEKSTKKSLIDNLLKILLKLKINSDHLIKSMLKQKYCHYYKAYKLIAQAVRNKQVILVQKK